MAPCERPHPAMLDAEPSWPAPLELGIAPLVSHQPATPSVPAARRPWRPHSRAPDRDGLVSAFSLSLPPPTA